MNSRQALKAYEAGQRETARLARGAVERYLTECEDIIADVECVYVTGIPSGQGRAREWYDEGLELRSQALSTLQYRPGKSVVAVATQAQEAARLGLRALLTLIEAEHVLFPERKRRVIPSLL